MATTTLANLFCRRFESLSDMTTFISDFNAIVAGTTTVTDDDDDELDHYGDGSIGYDDRDYWVDWLIRRYWPSSSRLMWGESAPSDYDESDPLGLVSGRDNVVFLDSANSSKVYVLESSNNRCYTDEDRTIAAATPLLFNGTTGAYQPSNMVWGDFRCFAETPSSTSRRFPDSTDECNAYIRGGSYTLDREIQIIKQSGVTNNPSAINIRAYPGEIVHIYVGNQFINPSYDNTVMMTISRPDLHIDGNVIIHGYRVDGSGNRIFSAGVLSVTNAADRFRFTGTVRDFRAIAPDHPNAITLPDYVDYAFYYRTNLDSGNSTGKMLSAIGIEIGQGNVGSTLENATIHPADDDIPPSVTVPGGVIGASYGESVDAGGVTDFTVRRCTFSGTSSHSAMRIRESGGITPSGCVIEYNDMRNPENTALLLSNCDDSFIRYNRVHDFANRQDLATNDGFGITQADGDGNEITGNVVWLGATQGGDTNYGIAVQVSQSDAATGFNNNLIARNVVYGCGIFLGYSSGTITTNIGRLANNVVEDNVIDGVSDYHATGVSSDGPIVLNIGPNVTGHSDLLYPNGNVIQDNILRQFDADTTVVVEKYYNTTTGSHSQVLDYTIADKSPWLLRNIASNPLFYDADNGDFMLLPDSPATAYLGDDIPLRESDLEADEVYECPSPSGLPGSPILFTRQPDSQTLSARQHGSVTSMSRVSSSGTTYPRQ